MEKEKISISLTMREIGSLGYCVGYTSNFLLSEKGDWVDTSGKPSKEEVQRLIENIASQVTIEKRIENVINNLKKEIYANIPVDGQHYDNEADKKYFEARGDLANLLIRLIDKYENDSRAS